MGGLRSSPKHESRVEYLVKLNTHRAAVMHEAVRKFEEGLVMAKKERKYDAKYFIKVIIGFIIVWCFGFLPAPEPMTAVGMRLIGIFFGTIWLFSFAGVIWPSIMAVLAVGYSGAFPSLSAAITAAFGNTILWQLLILMPICEAISRSGATQKIAAWLLSRPFVKGNP